MPEQKFLHKCPYLSCSFTSFTRPQYNEHKKTHAGDTSLKVSKCNFKDCNKIFMRKEDYNSHMISVHKVLLAKKPVFVMVSA